MLENESVPLDSIWQCSVCRISSVTAESSLNVCIIVVLYYHHRRRIIYLPLHYRVDRKIYVIFTLICRLGVGMRYQVAFRQMFVQV